MNTLRADYDHGDCLHCFARPRKAEAYPGYLFCESCLERLSDSELNSATKKVWAALERCGAVPVYVHRASCHRMRSPAPPVIPIPPPPPSAVDKVIYSVSSAIGTSLGYLLLWAIGTAAILVVNFVLCALAITLFPQARTLMVLIFLIWTACGWISFMRSTLSTHKGS